MTTTTSDSSDTVLVTGINGYIGAHIALGLLQAGYNVRGAVRSLAKSEAFRQLPHFKQYAEDRLTFVEVPDIAQPGAYDDAVKDVAIVIHLAAPVFLGGDFDSTIVPAKMGTLNMLQSILDKSSPSKFRQLIYFSSIAAVVNPYAPHNSTFTEKDWNPVTEEIARDMPPEVLAPISYYVSKGIAERTVWEFVKTHQPSWTTCSLNPAVVYGPIKHPVASPEQLNLTTKPVWDLYSGSIQQIPENIAEGAYVDIRDVTAITTWAIQHPDKVAGKRFIISAGCGPMQAVADILRERFPDRKQIIPAGEPGKGYKPENWGWGPDATWCFSSQTVEELTGIKWVRFEDSVGETIRSIQEVFGV